MTEPVQDISGQKPTQKVTGNYKLYLFLFFLDHILKVNQYLRCHEAW